MKKSLLFLVVFALLWGGAATAQAGTVSGECGAESANLTWTLDTQTGVLEISGTGAMKDYDSSGSNRAPWYNYYSSITSVTIGEGVTTIGDYAFRGCERLISVTIPESITSIGFRAFDGCTSLKKVYISDLAAWCRIDFKDSYSNPLSEAHNLYLDNTLVTDLKIPDDITEIYPYAFYDCDGLTSVTIGNSVTSIGRSAFYDCDGLTSVTIGNGVTTIGSSAFSGCSRLKSVTIGDGVTTIGDYAFRNCENLTSVTIPESVTSIGEEAFYNCTGLAEVTIGNGVTTIGNSAFGGCTGLQKFDGKFASSDHRCLIVNDKLRFFAPSGLTEYSIPNEVKVIGEDAFYNCTGLKSVTIPEGVTSIGESAFYDCKNLTSITIPNSVTTIGENAFSGCSGLTSVTIGDGVTSIGNSAFSFCAGLTSVTIGNGVISIGDWAFHYCLGLKSVTIPEGVTSIGEVAFYSCTSLESVTIGNGVTSIGEEAFSGCTGLEKFEGKFASKDNRCLVVNDTLRFFAPSGLKQYTTPDGVTTIGSWAFYNCSGLTSVTIGNGVTTIDYLAFDGCSGLISLTIGEGVTTIGSRAFARCTNLWTITPLSTTPPDFPGDTFDDITYKNARVFPPKGSLNTYQGHSAWKRFNYTPVQSRLNPRVINGTAGQTTYSCTLSYTRDIDSPVSKFYILSEGKEYLVDPSKNTIPITVIDLEPQTEYKDLEFVIETVYGEKAAVSVTFTTDTVHLTTQPAKNTNAKATLEAAVECDAETGYGFEWRRYGAPDNLPPTRVEAYNIDGKISGTLRKLTPDTYYEYRPYYCTAKGKYYYGAWLSFGTFDYGVEWDPTVSTRTGEVRGNTTTLSGYIVEGSDEIISQGFEYWAESPAGSTIAGEHKRVEGSGSLMNVTLTGLDYNTIYYYRAYATTAKKTTYGTIESFTTGENPNPSGVEETAAEEGFAVRLSGNPVRNGEIGVQVVGADGATWYRVISLHGAQIAQGVLSGTDEWQPVKIPAASTGYYLLQIIGSKGTKTLRIVVE